MRRKLWELAVIYANCVLKHCKTRLQHRSGYRNVNKRQYLSLVGFRTVCAALCAAASFHFQFRGRIAPRNESHEGEIVTVWEKSTGGLPSSTAASNFPLFIPLLRLSRRSFQCIDEHAGHIETCLVHDFAEARRAGHVHFGQIVADSIESDKQQAAREKRLSQRFRNLAIVFRERLCATQSAR